MYRRVVEADCDLRQGDIVRGLAHVKPDTKPRFLCIDSPKGAKARIFTPVESNKRLSAVVELTFGSDFSVILSQCCQLERHSDSCKAKSLLLCPLNLIPAKSLELDAVALAEVRKNNPDTYVSNYFFGSWNRLLKEPLLADFAHIFSVSSSPAFYKKILDSRICHLKDSERIKFKDKLARYFGRPTQEERAAGLWGA